MEQVANMFFVHLWPDRTINYGTTNCGVVDYEIVVYDIQVLLNYFRHTVVEGLPGFGELVMY